jgi:hypothetical protein
MIRYRFIHSFVVCRSSFGIVPARSNQIDFCSRSIVLAVHSIILPFSFSFWGGWKRGIGAVSDRQDGQDHKQQ